MPDTIFTAPKYDPAKERKRKWTIIIVVVAVIVVAGLIWWFRYWPEERVASRFFADLQAKNYKAAYGVWMHDPQWEQHPDKYKSYPFNDFYRDWGPGGDWGLINTYKIDGAVSASGSSGVIVQATINNRVEKARVWVEKKDKTMTFCMAAGC